jgi:GTP-binding protein HflX
VEEHSDVPVADDGQWEALVSKWQRRPDSMRAHAPTDEANASYVAAVSVGDPQGTGAAAAAAPTRLDEIVSLVRTQGDRVVGSESLLVKRPNPKMVLGSGLARALGERAAAAGANMLVIDAALSPSQTRNLEDATGLPICDREAVILNVFYRHARTRRARVQVEIAQLEYLRPRIRGIGLEMDRQAGGVMGSRGSGDTASELLARQLDGRIVALRKVLAKIERLSSEQRKRRARCDRIALVGYTNAGKTSIMNQLTGAGLSAADRLFETLDATSRTLSRHGGEVLVSDTVGFIRDLPDHLLASFESTLDEIREASLIAVVIDASDPERELHLRTTEAVLDSLGAGSIDRLHVFNKIDRLGDPDGRGELAGLSAGIPFVAMSSRSAADVERLRDALLAAVRRAHHTIEIVVPYEAADAIAFAYGRCRVLEVESLERGLRFVVEAEPAAVSKLERLAKESR